MLALMIYRADLNEEFNVNVMGTHIVTTKFLPLLRKGEQKKIMNM
jgi:NAD(P)-dependent dehydrogenase (short-subunit alcohol dehydrogenase family)